MKNILVSLLFCAASASTTFFEDAFRRWMRRHSISYETALEKRYRFSVFAAKYADVIEEFEASPIADMLFTTEKYECAADKDGLSNFCFI
jgi:hypothetical protein